MAPAGVKGDKAPPSVAPPVIALPAGGCALIPTLCAGFAAYFRDAFHLFGQKLFKGFCHAGHHFEQVAHDSIVRLLEYGCIRIFVDSDNDL